MSGGTENVFVVKLVIVSSILQLLAITKVHCIVSRVIRKTFNKKDLALLCYTPREPTRPNDVELCTVHLPNLLFQRKEKQVFEVL